MWLTRTAIARPLFIWMIVAALSLLGARAFFQMPAELNPRITYPTILITTALPGAGPSQVESAVTKPVEDAVGSVAGLEGISSSSESGLSIVVLDLALNTDLDAAANDIRSRVDAVRLELPAEARPPVVSQRDFNAQPILTYGLSSRLPIQSLRHLADTTVRYRLAEVPGVASVEVTGGWSREVHVSVSRSALEDYGLTVEDVANALKAASLSVPGGAVTRGVRTWDVRVASGLSSLDAIRNAPILAAFAGGPGARPAVPLRVQDVARVSESHAPPDVITRIQGRESVAIAVHKLSDANTLSVAAGVKAALAALRPSLPADLKFLPVDDQSTTVRDALDDVNAALVLGALLAVAIVYLFLHNARATLIIALAIPTSILATFLVIHEAGFTLNQMTLLGFSLAVGILVDDSILILENITRHLELGERPREAALNGRSEIGLADTSTTLVDVVVFVPIAFMGGIVGQFFRPFGLTVATATLFSLFVSFSVTPMLAARWLRPADAIPPKRGLFHWFDRAFGALDRGYRRVLPWALTHRPAVLGAFFGLLALGILAGFLFLGVEFTPAVDQGQVGITVELPPGSSLAATDAVVRQVAQVATSDPDVQTSYATAGAIRAGFSTVPQSAPQVGQVTLRLREREGVADRLRHPFGETGKRVRSDDQIAEALRRRLARVPGARIDVSAVRGLGGELAPIEIELRGQDIDRLERVALELQARLAALPVLLNPDVSARPGRPEVKVRLDAARAAALGVAPDAAALALRDSIAGNTDVTARLNQETIPVRVQLAGLDRTDPADVGRVPVGWSGGRPVELADVADVALAAGPSRIDRSQHQRAVTVTADLAPGVPLGTAQPQITAAIDAVAPPDVTVHQGGDTEALAENGRYMAEALILGALLVYMLMVALFNSLLHPLTIMLSLPMGLVGGICALAAVGETLNIAAMIGVIMLVGIATRNAILLLDYTNTLRARGQARDAALCEAGPTRLRPILMTTLTVVFGSLPVALRIGRASELRAPMATCVIGGLLVSTVLTLVVIPVWYSLFDDWLGARQSRRAAKAGNAL